MLGAGVAMTVSPLRLFADQRAGVLRSGAEAENGQLGQDSHEQGGPAHGRHAPRTQAADGSAQVGAAHAGDVAAVRPMLEAIARRRAI